MKIAKNYLYGSVNTPFKANLIFTSDAWHKMSVLVSGFTSEIAWHGICQRGEDPYTYKVTDILVYPQEVTGATVTTDQVGYEQFLDALDEGELGEGYSRELVRFQGHSHVNMGTTPSTVDDTLYDSLSSMIGDDDFYVFMIVNKKDDKWISIIDKKENLVFETVDVKISIDGDAEFLAKAKELCKTRVVTPKSVVPKTTAKPLQQVRPAYPYYGSGYDDDDDSYYGKYYNK